MHTEGPVIALTGATGFVGQSLIERLLEAGCSVRALARREQAPRTGVVWVPGDLGDGAALSELTRGAEAIIHVAGVTNAPDPAGFEAGNVTGTLNLIETAAAKGLHRFLFVSSLSAREPQLSAYGASKAKAEKLLKASSLDWTIVRPPAIYGPRDKEMMELFRAARWGLVPVPRGGRASMIHVEDLARLLVALISGQDAVLGKTFEPDDGKPGGWAHTEMARAIGWAMGRRVKVIELSQKALERVARFDRFVRGTKAKMTLDRAAYMSHPDWVVSPENVPPASLWEPRIETRAGLHDTAQWYRDNNWL